MSRARWWWRAAAALAALIFVLSSLPAERLGPDGLWRVDKLVHASTWATLAALIAGGGAARGWRVGVAIAVAWVVASGYGILDELHQSTTPGRDASVGDALADASGALVGAALGVWLQRWRSSGATRGAAR